MTNTTAVVASNETDTIAEDTHTTGTTTGHSHSEQLAQHQTSSSSSSTTTPVLQATNTSAIATFTAEPSSVQESDIQSHSRHGNERIASDSNSESTAPSLSKKCTFNKNSNLVNKSNNSVNKYTKFSERVQLKSPGTMVAMPDDLLSENNNLDDTSEELQYGPGIVSKLRCRYLSLALRQSANKQRPSLDNLRRATSLNNLIDEEDEQNVSENRQTWPHQERMNSSKEKARTPDEYIPFIRRAHNEQTENRCRPNQRGNDSLKRARSVEALMRYDQTAWQRDINKDSIDQTANTLIVLEEITNEQNKVNGSNGTNGTDVVTIEEKIIQARERGEPKPKRLTSFMDETERPPPDLVKHTLRIFEASANRRPRIGAKGNGGVAAKVANYKTIIMQEKPQIVFPKPPLSPKKPVIKPRTSSPKQVLNGNRYTNGNGNGTDLNKIPTIDINVAKSNFEHQMIVSPTSNGAKKIADVSRSPSPLSVRVDMAYRTNKFESSPLSPLQTSRAVNNGQAAYSTSPLSPVSAAPRPLPRQELLRTLSDVNAQTVTESPITMLGKKLETLAIESPRNGVAKLNLSDIESDEADANNSNDTVDDSDTDKPSKRISKTALDNIAKAGVTTEFNFFAQSSKSHLPAGPLNGNCSTPIKSASDTNEQMVRQIGIIRPQVKASVTPSPPNIPPPKVMHKKDNQSAVLNESLEEKPNRDKLLITNLTSPANILLTTREIEQNLINKEKSDEIKWLTKSNSVPIAKPWQKQEQNNTMVFNFSNKKDVPDYIEKFENDGLVVRRKRDWTKVSDFYVFGFSFLKF